MIEVPFWEGNTGSKWGLQAKHGKKKLGGRLPKLGILTYAKNYFQSGTWGEKEELV